MKNTYGVKPLREEGKELEGYKSDIYPNATIEEVKKNAIEVPNPIREGFVKKYTKGDFGYFIDGRDIKAIYLPSMQLEQLKIMFTWNSKKKKWVLLTYREGDR